MPDNTRLLWKSNCLSQSLSDTTLQWLLIYLLVIWKVVYETERHTPNYSCHIINVWFVSLKYVYGSSLSKIDSWKSFMWYLLFFLQPSPIFRNVYSFSTGIHQKALYSTDTGVTVVHSVCRQGACIWMRLEWRNSNSAPGGSRCVVYDEVTATDVRVNDRRVWWLLATLHMTAQGILGMPFCFCWLLKFTDSFVWIF